MKYYGKKFVGPLPEGAARGGRTLSAEQKAKMAAGLAAYRAAVAAGTYVAKTRTRRVPGVKYVAGSKPKAYYGKKFVGPLPEGMERGGRAVSASAVSALAAYRAAVRSGTYVKKSEAEKRAERNAKARARYAMKKAMMSA